MAEQAMATVVRHLNTHAAPRRTGPDPLLPAPEGTTFRSILPAPCTHRAVKHYGGREQAIRRQEAILGPASSHYLERDLLALALAPQAVRLRVPGGRVSG